MVRRAFAVAGLLALLAAWGAPLSLKLGAMPAWSQGAAPCARTAAAPAGALDLDIVRCQVALDAQRLGELQSQANAATAAATLLRADLAAAEAQKATLVDWLKAAQR